MSRFSLRKTKSGVSTASFNRSKTSEAMHEQYPISCRAEEAQRHSLIGGIEPLSALAKGKTLCFASNAHQHEDIE